MLGFSAIVSLLCSTVWFTRGHAAVDSDKEMKSIPVSLQNTFQKPIALWLLMPDISFDLATDSQPTIAIPRLGHG